ncbi:hypothetical protein B0A49_09229 [Cryomyces minteri]|uniref:Uncharacterized protein n=1 Tax=Cryomyces minteri TaxID=331657 RepID=A0A4U0WHR7_9PEZI|nr:hypothetical protein B0A49_09229 [Cryomyces minteri]
MSEMAQASTEPVFRAAKRRKVFRRRIGDDDKDMATQEPQSETSALPQTSSPRPMFDLRNSQSTDAAAAESSEVHVSIAEILRRRQLAKSRRGGIEFSNATTLRQSRSARTQQSDALAIAEPEQSAMEPVVNRFAPQTGKVADVLDKHMMAYVDSEMARLRHKGGFAPDQTQEPTFTRQQDTTGLLGEAHRPRQPAGLGKLQEIDLGPDATLRNIARTEAATRRLENGQIEEFEAPVGKVRLGKDGKPWRGRKRRNSEDVKRDKLVEEVLNANEDQAADDRIAEQFRREFMDAINSKHVRRTAPTMPGGPTKGGKVDDRPKGPKLGGSRSARAAMRALEEKAGKKK